MERGILNLGNKIEMQEILTTLKDDPERENRVYTSQLLEFDETDEDVLNIAMPIFEGKLIALEVGRRFLLYFYAGKGMYTAECVIENRYKTKNIYVLVVRLQTALKSFQRRQYFRLDHTMEVQYKILSEEDDKFLRLMDKLSDEFLERPYDGTGVTIDISGGGLKYVSKHQHAKGDKILFHITLDLGTLVKTVDAVAKVIASIPARNKADVYENRIEFCKIQDSDRETIIKYIFQTERNMRKKK